MQGIHKIIVFISLVLLTVSLPAQEPFNADSAYAYLEHLAVDIGPRMAGSKNERKALAWSADRFASFGADTAYMMPLTRISGGINTTSGIAVGVFKGTLDSIIVIGGHIDSDRADNPGASDNASGAACTIELARNWRNADRKYTMVFCTFGAEESGLKGSEHFVNHYSDIDKVALMFSIDMAGSEGWLIPFIDMSTHQSPQWLVEDAYAVDRSIGYNALEYPTHFFSLNSALGGAGSDHMPFMEKDIPAIDFTAGINIDPIHTPHDRIEFVSKPMLTRSGMLVSKLVEKYQRNTIPAAKKGHYMMWETPFGGQLFIPSWFIIALNVLAIGLGLFTIYRVNRQRTPPPPEERGRIPGIKLILMLLTAAIFMQFGEILMEVAKGVRFPWAVHVEGYFWFSAIWALLGAWVGAWLTQKIKLTPDPAAYAIRAIIAFLVLLGLFWLQASARMAFYPALSLIVFAAGVLLPGQIFKLMAMLLSPLPMLNLMFFEALPFIARSSMQQVGFNVSGLRGELMFMGFLTLALTIWNIALPFVIAYTVTSVEALQHFGSIFRRSASGFILLLIVTAISGYMYSLDSYSEKWQPELRLRATYDMNNGADTLRLTSNDYFKRVRVKAGSTDNTFNGKILKADIDIPFKADWFTIEDLDTVLHGDSLDTLKFRWTFETRRNWYALQLNIGVADSGSIGFFSTDWNYRQQGPEQGILMRWFADPPDSITVAARMTVSRNCRAVLRRVEAIYPMLPVQAKVEADIGPASVRTTVTYQDTIRFR